MARARKVDLLKVKDLSAIFLQIRRGRRRTPVVASKLNYRGLRCAHQDDSEARFFRTFSASGGIGGGLTLRPPVAA